MIPLAIKLFLGALGIGGIGALIFIPSVLPATVRALTIAWGWATKNPAAALCGLFLATTVWFWHGRNVEKAGRAADKAAYVIAQKQAVAKQEAQDQTNFAGQIAAIKQQDAAHVQLEAARNDAAGRFIASHRMPAQACRPTGGTITPAMHPDPRAPVDGSTAGDFVAVKPEAIDAWSKIELQNTERGDFLRGLVDQGLGVAIPDVEFGKATGH